LPDVKTPLKFTGPVLADIYLGKITIWNDERLRASNPGVSLPNLPIVAVRRAGGSGTTFIWTDYLSKVSAEWKVLVGAKSEPGCPTGGGGTEVGFAGEKGTAGVAGRVSQTVGAIGYVELPYALGSGLAVGHVRNQEGVFVAPSLESVTAAATNSLRDIPDDLRY